MDVQTDGRTDPYCRKTLILKTECYFHSKILLIVAKIYTHTKKQA